MKKLFKHMSIYGLGGIITKAVNFFLLPIYTYLCEPPKSDPEIVELFKKRLGLSNEEFIELMTLPKKGCRDYETYKPTFERWRLFFYLMAKADLISWSFYIEYTSLRMRYNC